MNITLYDIFLATGSIAFILISVVTISVYVLIYKAGKKIDEAQEQSKRMIQDALYKKYSVQAGVLRFLIYILGGDERER